MKKVQIMRITLLTITGGFMLAVFLNIASAKENPKDMSLPDMYVHIDDSKNYLSSVPLFYENESRRICTIQEEHPVYVRDERGGYFYYIHSDIVTENEIREQ